MLARADTEQAGADTEDRSERGPGPARIHRLQAATFLRAIAVLCGYRRDGARAEDGSGKAVKRVYMFVDGLLEFAQSWIVLLFPLQLAALFVYVPLCY